MTISRVGLQPTAVCSACPVMMRSEHLPQALELSRALKWPYRLEDWAFAHKLGRGYAVEVEGRLAGTALWWPYGDHFASVGMIIVAADQQQKGIGRAMMDRLLSEAAGRTIILNSTKEGMALYARLGFVTHGHVNQHQAHLSSLPAAAPGDPVRSFQADDLQAIYNLDHAATGMDRQALINELIAVGDVKVIDRGGHISGYGCVRTWGRGVVIGPVVAADIADARALIAALAALHANCFVRIDVPAAVGLSPWLESIGLPLVDQVEAMALGDLPKLDTGWRLFALSNQSLG